jgi:arylsulfatase
MSSRPNILLLTVDSLRYDELYGDQTDTPNIDRLRAESVEYTSGFSQGPYTTFSIPSLFVSQYPSSLEYVELSDSTVGVSVGDEPTLPELLAEAGYRTGGFHSNPLLSNLFGLDIGFDAFDASLPFSESDRLPGRLKVLSEKFLRLFRKRAYTPGEQLTANGVDWIDESNGTRPFFLWLHYMDPHGPYHPKAESGYLSKYRAEKLWRKAQAGSLTTDERERLRDSYREEIEYLDGCVGTLLDELRTRELSDSTIIVFTSDHGELFGEYVSYSHPHLLYDELTHVPLTVRLSGGKDGTIEQIVELLDVGPRLLCEAGIERPECFTGKPLPTTPSETEPLGVAISEADVVPAYHGSVRTDGLRYVRNDIKGEEEFIVQGTSGEVNDQVREEFRERLNDHLNSPGRAVGEERNVNRSDVGDDDVERRLRTLGYLE